MVNSNEYCLSDGSDSLGMTDIQYKGMLLDQLEDWQEIFDLSVKSQDAAIKKKAEQQIDKLKEKLRF